MQAQVAKAILGIPVQAPNIGAVAEIGLKTFKHQLFDHQLRSYFRLLHLPQDRLASVALKVHMSADWNSPYLKYIYELRREVGLLKLPLTVNMVSTHLKNWFLQSLNNWISLSKLPALGRLKNFSKQEYDS